MRVEYFIDKIEQVNHYYPFGGLFGERQERISSLESTLSTISILENSSQVYRLSHSTDNYGNLKYSSADNVIDICITGRANFVHEVTHAGQFEKGELAFYNDDSKACQDVYDEVAAYKAQYAFNPWSVKNLSSSSSVHCSLDITPLWVQGLKKGGITPYVPGGAYNTGIVPVNIDSPAATLMRAYPGLHELPANYTLRSNPRIYYKR